MPVWRAWVLLALVSTTSLGCVRSVAERGTGWRRVTTDHVQLDTDVDPARAVTAGWAFEDDYRALAAVFPQCQAPEITERVLVTMFARGDDYDAVAPASTSGFFRPARDGIAADPPILVVRSGSGIANGYFTQVYVHELTHRFVARCFPDAPPWLHEGMARFFETMQVGGDAVTVGIAPYHVSAQSAYVTPFLSGGLEILQIGRDRMPLPKALVAMPDSAFYQLDHRSWNYGSAWALVHMLSLGTDADLRERFTRYLAGTATHGADPSWFEASFTDVPLDDTFASYVTGHYLQRHVPYTPPPLADPPAIALAPGEVHLQLAMLAARRGDAGVRRDVLAHVALAALEPATLARARLMQLALGDVDETRTKAGHLADIAAAFADDIDVLSVRALFELGRSAPTNEGRWLLDHLSARDDVRAIDLARMADLARTQRLYVASLAFARRAVQLSPSSSATHSALARALWSHRYRAEAAAERRLAQITAGHGAPLAAPDASESDAWTDAAPVDASTAAAPPAPTTLPEAPAEDGSLAHLTGAVLAPLRASTLDERCIGFVGAPIAVLALASPTPLVVRTRGTTDMVLVIEDAEHHLHCDDDSGGDTNSAVYAMFPAGTVAVRVGSFNPSPTEVPYDIVVERGDVPLDAAHVPRDCGPAAQRLDAVAVGTRVVLGRHVSTPSPMPEDAPDPIRDENWVPEMDAFVGRTAHVIERMPFDAAGCPVVRVDADDGTWLWRVRDMAAPPPRPNGE